MQTKHECHFISTAATTTVNAPQHILQPQSIWPQYQANQRITPKLIHKSSVVGIRQCQLQGSYRLCHKKTHCTQKRPSLHRNWNLSDRKLWCIENSLWCTENATKPKETQTVKNIIIIKFYANKMSNKSKFWMSRWNQKHQRVNKNQTAPHKSNN